MDPTQEKTRPLSVYDAGGSLRFKTNQSSSDVASLKRVRKAKQEAQALAEGTHDTLRKRPETDTVNVVFGGHVSRQKKQKKG